MHTLQKALHTELNRLLAKGLTPDQEVIARRYYSDKERESMDESSFCGPHQSFPITSQEDVTNAAHLVGHADNPDAVKACIKRKAKAHGWKLPESWQEEEDRAAVASPSTPTTPTVDDHDTQQRTAMPELGDTRLYAPLVRIDSKNWEVEGVATSEEVDSFGTIFSYEASKKAFQEWSTRSANVREMHDRKAVGKGINWWPDDKNRKIHVLLRVSRGAPDTWLKVEDGVLNGLSVGATKPVWGTIERNGKIYPYLKSYDLAELSLVDNASNPDSQGLVIARADGLTELVDVTEETTSTALPPPLNRAGARVGASTRDAMHESIKHTLHAAATQMKNCGCDTCTDAMAYIDPDNDGDIDLGGYDDPDNDNDWQSLYKNKETDMDRAITAALERILPSVVERIMSPVYQRQQQILARMAQTPESDFTALEERITTTLERVASSSSSLAEVRAEMSTVKERVERMEAQPAVGMAPILNGSRPVDKSFPLDRASQPSSGMPQAGTVNAALGAMQGAGLLDSQDLQMKAAALLLQMQQR